MDESNKGKDGGQNNKNLGGTPQGKSKNLVFFLIIFLAGLLLFMMNEEPESKNEIAYSEFLSMLDDEYIKWNIINIVSKDIQGRFSLDIEVLEDANKSDIYLNKYKKYKHVGRTTNNEEGKEELIGQVEYYITTYSPASIDTLMVNKLLEKGVKFNSSPPETSIFKSIILPIIPWLLIFGILWFFMFRQIQGGGNRALSFGKSKARLAHTDQNKVTFADVAGVEEAKEELKEAVDFLKSPGKFKKLGAKIPKGVLLIGPPGTGKTLLARAVAGEANRPFFSMSGSEFVEMFVGVGASRVRDLFEQGKKNAPCIIFIDELDAVGRIRGSGYGGGHDEREQTLNQMLVEMDGFNTDMTVIVMAATNRADVLDPALLRPGRFDRRVIVSPPDVKGREEILKIHMKNVPCSEGVDTKSLARSIPGLSGADIANLVNESALIAARNDRKKVQMEDFEYAKDKVLMGPERKSLVISEKERINTAYHEAGHAILSYMLPNENHLYKVSIIPRGQALGVTQTLPEERYTRTKESILSDVIVLFGGRIGEEYKFGAKGITNGSSNDIERGTKLVRTMVCEWGMSERLGPITYGQKEEPIFIGKEIARHKDYSEKTAELIDKEVKRIVDECFKKAHDMLYANGGKLELLAEALLKEETIDRAGIEALLGPVGSEQREEAIGGLVSVVGGGEGSDGGNNMIEGAGEGAGEGGGVMGGGDSVAEEENALTRKDLKGEGQDIDPKTKLA